MNQALRFALCGTLLLGLLPAAQAAATTVHDEVAVGALATSWDAGSFQLQVAWDDAAERFTLSATSSTPPSTTAPPGATTVSLFSLLQSGCEYDGTPDLRTTGSQDSGYFLAYSATILLTDTTCTGEVVLEYESNGATFERVVGFTSTAPDNFVQVWLPALFWFLLFLICWVRLLVAGPKYLFPLFLITLALHTALIPGFGILSLYAGIFSLSVVLWIIALTKRFGFNRLGQEDRL